MSSSARFYLPGATRLGTPGSSQQSICPACRVYANNAATADFPARAAAQSTTPAAARPSHVHAARLRPRPRPLSPPGGALLLGALRGSARRCRSATRKRCQPGALGYKPSTTASRASAAGKSPSNHPKKTPAAQRARPSVPRMSKGGVRRVARQTRPDVASVRPADSFLQRPPFAGIASHACAGERPPRRPSPADAAALAAWPPRSFPRPPPRASTPGRAPHRPTRGRRRSPRWHGRRDRRPARSSVVAVRGAGSPAARVDPARRAGRGRSPSAPAVVVVGRLPSPFCCLASGGWCEDMPGNAQFR